MTDQKMDKDRLLVRTSWVSTAGNALLAAGKIGVGLGAGSMAVLGDGIDSSIDVVISLVMVAAAHIIRRPPSRRYPFGYDKAESVATIALSLVVLFAGVQMLVPSVGAVFSGEARPLPGRIALWMTAVSIVGKTALAWHQFRVGRRIGSEMLVANAKNMRSDVLISVGVLAGLGFTYLLNMPLLDAVTGCVIGLFIVRTGLGIFLDSGRELMDANRDETIYHRIFDAVARVPEAQNPHHIRVRTIGGRYMIDLDIELDGDMTVRRAHDVADRVEESIRAEVVRVYDIEVHVEPLGAHRMAEPFGVEVDDRRR